MGIVERQVGLALDQRADDVATAQRVVKFAGQAIIAVVGHR